MSISSEITRITNAVANAYTEADAKGAEMPSALTVANLANTIKSIAGNIGAFENLLNPTLTTTTLNGVTCTDNGDGSYTLNGTATSGTNFVLQSAVNFPSGNIKLVGCPANGSGATYQLQLYETATTARLNDIGSGANGSLTQSNNWIIRIQVQSGTVCNNLVFKPIITTNLNVTYDNWYPKIKNVENLFVPTLETQTLNGVTVTNNGDGTYTLNGTATARTDFSIATNTKMIQFYNSLGGKTVRFVGCPAGGNDSTYRLNSYISGSKVVNVFEYGNGRTIELPTNVASANFVITVQNGYTCNNLVIKPMITENLSATYGNFVKRVGGFNNLFVPTLATQVINGVTVTSNSDGSYTLNGTCTASANVGLSDYKTIVEAGKTYKVSGCPKGGSTSKYYLAMDSNSTNYAYDYGDGAVYTFSSTDDLAVRLKIFIVSGQTYNNLVFKPMVTESLLPEYYDFVKGIEAGGKFAYGYFYGDGTMDHITIPHNLGIKPRWFSIMQADTTDYTNYTRGAIYNEDFSSTIWLQARSRTYAKSVGTVKGSTSTAYIGTDVITVPQYSSTYYWIRNGAYIWMCGE